MSVRPCHGLAVALALLLSGAAAPPVRGESPASINAPIEGEAVLNRDAEVRILPREDSRIIMTLKEGKRLNALDTPRGTTWTKVAIGGQPIGYVPWDALDPAFIIAGVEREEKAEQRRAAAADKAAGKEAGKDGPATSATTGALVPLDAWTRAVSSNGGAGMPVRGYMVATRTIKATLPSVEKKKPTVTLSKGDVAGFLGFSSGQVDLIVPGVGTASAPAAGLTGVASAYPQRTLPPMEKGPQVAIRIGEYPTYEEALNAWNEFVAGPGLQFRDVPPMVWPRVSGRAVSFATGIGPFTRAQTGTACAELAKRGRGCTLMPLTTF
mgnify:CR=1 FL=1